MRKLTITENVHGTRSQFIVETSAGVRAVGASLQSALDKVLPVSCDVECLDDGYDTIRCIMAAIRPSTGRSQIHKGQEGA